MHGLQASAMPAESKVTVGVTVAAIRKLVCSRYGISEVEMCSARMTSDLIRPRHVAIYLASILTLKSNTEIGILFGNRDRATIRFAQKKIANWRLRDMVLNAEIRALTFELTGTI